jgi:hypothetical protein
MSSTTDLEGGLYGPSKEDLAAAAKVTAASTYAQGMVDAAKVKEEGPAFGPGSKLLGRPGFVPEKPKAALPVADQHLAEAALQGAGLGEGTSFKGGAGAPEPISVIRGIRQTYASEAGGPNLTEFATPVQATQAYNREQQRLAGGPTNEAAVKQYGSFVPAGGAMEQLKAEAASAANKRPVLSAMASRLTAQTYTDSLRHDLISQGLGVDVGEGKKALPPEVESMIQAHSRFLKDEPSYQQVLGKIIPAAQLHQEISGYNDKTSGGAIRKQILDANPDLKNDKAFQTRVKEEIVTPKNVDWWRQQINKVKAQPGAPATPAGGSSTGIGIMGSVAPPEASPTTTQVGPYQWNTGVSGPVPDISALRRIAETGGPVDIRGGGLWAKNKAYQEKVRQEELAKDLAFKNSLNQAAQR